MLITVKSLKYFFGVKPIGIVHVGAHGAEEAPMYRKHFGTPVIWIEAQRDLADKLRIKFEGTNQTIIQAAVWDVPGMKLTLKNTSNTQSASLLNLGTHAKNYPQITVMNETEVTTETLSAIIPSTFRADFINLDIQGAELNALKGMGEKLSQFKWIYSEVNKEEVYKGCSLVSDMDSFLSPHNFRRIETRWYLGRGWGDALYIKSNNRAYLAFLRIIGLLHSAPWLIREILKLPIRSLVNTKKLFLG